MTLTLHRLVTPPRLVVGSFAFIILLGASILGLPWMQAEPVSYLDCLFTSTSAVCVTGLITVDTAKVWTSLGQAVIVVLIQLGGLGIMTLSVALLYLSGRRPSPLSHRALYGALGPIPGSEMGRMTKDVVLYTLVLEGLGAAFLFYRFLADHPPLRALGYAVFHSVSAFCNAGFSTFSNNLENYPADPVVNLTVMGLIVLGGIGFVVMREVWPRLIRPGEVRPRLSLHSRLALWTTFILILGGAGLLALLEYLSNGGLVWRDSLWPIFFTSITPRTAGFNTIPLGELSNASLLIIIVLMFIGASPGSTGGGVKTTTAAALTLLVVNRFRGKSWTGLAGRRIPEETLSSSLALVLGTLTLLTLAVVLLLSLGLKASFLGRERGDLLLLLFEAVSAFGTVGLSLDVSPNLSPTGKVLIILLMFIGRVGPLTLVYSLAQQALAAKYQPAEEKIIIG